MKKYTACLAIIPIATGVLTLVGWLLGIGFLKQPFSGSVPINPMAALCLAFTGFALLIYYSNGRQKPVALLGPLLAVTVGLVGAVKLLSLLGLGIQIDTWLFHDQIMAERALGHPNRMAPNAAINFILMSVILLLSVSETKWLRNFCNYLALAVLVVGIFSFIGFIYRVNEYSGILNYLPMAVQTAVCFICLSLAYLFQNSDRAFMRVLSNANSGGKIARQLIPVAIIMPILFGYIRLDISWHMPLSVELGVAALTTSIIMIFLVVTWFAARALNISDEERRRIEELYQKMVSEVQDYSIVLLDEHGNIVNWNAGSEKMKGYSADEIIGSNFSLFYPPDALNNKLPQKLIAEALETGRAADEGWRVKKNGSLFWANVIITALYNGKGKVIGLSKVTQDLTERKQAELELQRQAALFNIMPDAVLYGNRDLTITSLNSAAQSLFEISEEKALTLKFDEIVKLDMIGETRENARNQLWGEQGFFSGEAIVTTHTGKKINVLLRLKKVDSEDGTRGNSFIGIYTDITHQKEDQQRLQYALDGMVAGLWEWNQADPEKGWISPRYSQLLGYDMDDLKPSVSVFKTLVHPDELESVLDFFKLIRTGKTGLEKDMRYLTKSGDYKWFSVSGKTKFDANGKPISVIGSIVDVDEKRKAQNTIKEQAALIQILPDAIVSMDLERRVTRWNEGAERLFKVSANYAIGKLLYDLIKLDVTGAELEEWQKELQQFGSLRNEGNIVNVDGDRLKMLVTTILVKDLDGRPIGLSSIFTDISVLKVNEELGDALKKLETNNQYLEQLAFIGAHDIKAPIHTLGGLTDLLIKSKTVGPQDVQILEMQKDVIMQMQRTNKGLNDILKLRKGLLLKESIHGDAVSIKEMVGNIKNTLQPEIEKLGATLSINLHSVAEVKFPSFYLQSVFYNLLANTIRYRDPARPLVIGFEASKNAEDIFSFKVSDNGLGFDMVRSQGKLFGIFKRFHPQIEGTGIGLHIVKSVVDAYGGEITVISQVGKGTTFEINMKNPILAI